MPNTRPPLDSAEMIVDLKSKAGRDGLIQVLPIGCVTQGRKGKALIYMEPLVKAGVVGFSDDGDPVKTDKLMSEALEISNCSIYRLSTTAKSLTADRRKVR